jgi:hypothetical protein
MDAGVDAERLILLKFPERGYFEGRTGAISTCVFDEGDKQVSYSGKDLDTDVKYKYKTRLYVKGDQFEPGIGHRNLKRGTGYRNRHHCR